MDNVMTVGRASYKFACLADLYVIAGALISAGIHFTVVDDYGKEWKPKGNSNRKWKSMATAATIAQAAQVFGIEYQLVQYMINVIGDKEIVAA